MKKMKQERYWIKINPTVKEIFQEILGVELLEAKMATMDITKDYQMVKVTMEMTADGLRKASMIAPGTINVSDFDLYNYNGLRFVLTLQYGDIISAYQEMY